MREARIAAFGGTFDPIHNGHLEVVRAVMRQFEIDTLLLIPAFRPPHKRERTLTGAYHRYAMSVLATTNEPRVVVSTMEIEAPNQPYTYETIERLNSELAERARLYLIVGADSFEDINSWREPVRLLSATNLIVVARPGHTVAYSHLDPQFRSNVIDLKCNRATTQADESLKQHYIYLTDCVNSDVSSTAIRRRIREGESIADQVPGLVFEYIKKYELYRGPFDASQHN